MFEKDNKNHIVFKIIFALIILVWSFGVARYGYPVDENGLLTIYKGVFQGQRMFIDSWESLQTGGLLAYPLLALYYYVLSPLFASASINVGLVLYMRYCYLTVRALVAIYLFIAIKNSKYESGAYPAALFYFMFVIGWKDFSYKSYCDIAIMLIVCFMFRFYQERKAVYAALTGVAVCIAVLAYPTMIIMAVLLGIFWLCIAVKDEGPWACFISYLAVCFIIGIAVVSYLQFTSGWGNIIAELVNFGDQDYDDPIYIRLGKLLASYGAFAVVAYFPILVINLIGKLNGIAEETERFILTLYFIIVMGGIFALRIESISDSRFVYGMLILFFWFPYFMRDKEEHAYIKIGSYSNIDKEGKNVLWVVFGISIAAQLIWSLSTNQGISVPGYMTLYTVIALILLFADEDVDYKGMNVVLILLAMFFNGIWVSDSNGGFCNVFEPMIYTAEGELKGVALPLDEYEMNEAVLGLLDGNVTADDKLLVAFGANSTGYINSEATQGTYSVYARTQVNTKLMDYYELHPENMADYMLLDKGHVKYERFLENETGKYLLSIYTNEVASDGNFVLLSR
ncbi:hypothetical protein [Pseudobutyrivibrio ruminis]|uniref:hypothetical protein n=1 Tax=Pseudobutyrivibrio ruminis TaxID=46206 RepID=UPI000415699F|nr:hypothetical protein [Pseudobutyrivibrio ruminis]